MVPEEISVKDLGSIEGKYQIVDIRDEIDYRYGSIAGAVHIPLSELQSAAGGFDRETLYIVMCKSGVVSDDAAAQLREAGLRAANLKEGYYGFMLERLRSERQLSADVEKSLAKKFKKTMPKLHSSNFAEMELIRPMYYIREQDVRRWRDYHDLHFLQCACKFTDTCTSCNPDSASKRQEIKNLIRELKKTNPGVERNIFNSVQAVNLDTVIGFKQNGTVHSFLDRYEEKA